MDAFLLHSLALVWAAAGGARRLGVGLVERLLVTALLVWADLVVTSLVLSCVDRLGDPRWFATVSLGLVLGAAIALRRLRPLPDTAMPGPRLTLVAWLLLGCSCLWPLLAGGGFSSGALAHDLPRVRYYLGQGSLAHFATGDPLQVWAPFNAHLLLLFASVHGAPLPVVPPGALAIWAGAAMGAVLWFLLRWRRSGLKRHALLAGLAAGLAGGSEPAWLVLGLAIVLTAGVVLLRARAPGAALGTGALAILLAAPFAGYNYRATGRLIPPDGLPWFTLSPWAQAAPHRAIPPLLRLRLVSAAHVNVDSDATHEEIFPLLSLRPGQRGTATERIETGAYTLISRARAGRGCLVSGRAQSAAVLLPIPEKRTAGVEFLGELGDGPDARDYYGLEADAGGRTPLDSNRYALLRVESEPGRWEAAALTRLRLTGLNPADALRVVVEADLTDWSSAPVATFTADGERTVRLERPLRWLTIRVTDEKSSAPLDPVELPVVAPTPEGLLPIALVPTDTRSLFVHESVVRRHDRGLITATGLLPTEGPHRYLGLPYVRWAGAPLVRLTIPATTELARLQLTFGVRPQARERVEFIVRLNGKAAGRYRIEGRDRWLDQTLDLTAAPGENTIEFVDITTRSGPDWLNYLERYPDVKTYLEASHLPLEPGAREHFERHGRAEGRTVQPIKDGLPDVPPESRYLLFRQLRLEGFKAP